MKHILYQLAVADEYGEKSGQYFDNDKGDSTGDFGNAHADAYNQTAIDALMQKTAEIFQPFNG